MYSDGLLIGTVIFSNQDLVMTSHPLGRCLRWSHKICSRTCRSFIAVS